MNNESYLSVWVKEDGTEIELNDLPATIAKAKEMGWSKSGAVDVSAMDKDELERFAKDKFGQDIDRRKGEDKLRAEVQAMIDGNS